MDYLHIILGLSNIIICIIIIIISIPTLLNKIKMNKVYGIRLKKAFESEDNWYKINSFGSKIFIIWAIIISILELIIIFFIPNNTNITFKITILYLPLLFFLIPTFQLSHFYKKIP